MAQAGRSTWQDVVIFWTKVLVVCLMLATMSFFMGRNYLGAMLTESEIREGAPELVVQVQSPSGEVRSAETPPPEKLEVSIQEREASDQEASVGAREMGLTTDSEGISAAGQDRFGPGDGDDEATPTWSDDAAERTASDQGPDDGDGRFVVVAGSFANPANAEAMLKELQAKGYRPHITRVTVGGQNYSRVNVGAFPNRNQADRLAEELTNAGYEATVGVR